MKDEFGIPSVMDEWDDEFKRRTGKWPFEDWYEITMLDGRKESGGWSNKMYFGIIVNHDKDIQK